MSRIEQSDRWGGYEIPRWEDPPGTYAAVSGVEAKRSIYVISREDGLCKIGISISPRRRLVGLQWANPTQKLTLEWSAEADWSKIAAAEKIAHKKLRHEAVRNEWFSISSVVAIDVAKAALQETFR